MAKKEIHETMAENRVMQPVAVIRMNGGIRRVREWIIRETDLSLHINGVLYATAMITAGMEREFALGHLLSQGIIRDADQITSLRLDGHGVHVTVQQTEKTAVKSVTSNLKVDPRQIFSCVKAILKSEVFAETEAVHSAGLFFEGETAVAIAEDLGRHHALDKCIGSALIAGTDFSQVLAASTGRQPAEMIRKCRNVGIPVMATKGVPTSLAVAMAEKSGITIAGLVRGKGMVVYSHPERIT